jgi:hypothetical protein
MAERLLQLNAKDTQQARHSTPGTGITLAGTQSFTQQLNNSDLNTIQVDPSVANIAAAQKAIG